MPISLKAALGGSSGLPRLAPDLAGAQLSKSISLPNTVTTEQLALSLSGKWVVSAIGLFLGNSWPTAQGTIRVRLVVDGETIWDSDIPSVPGGNEDIRIYGRTLSKKDTTKDFPVEQAFCIETSLNLYLTAPMVNSSTTWTLKYCARPIK